MTFKVSHSKIKTYRTCKKMADYKYVQKLRRKFKAEPLLRGTIIHDMLEEHISGRDPWPILKNAEKKYKKLFLEEREHYGDLIGDLKKIMTGYFDFYHQDPIKYLKFKGKYTEHYFEVPLTRHITLVGYLDSFGQTKDKLNWLVEHKSHKRLPEGDLAYSDIQSSLYTWVAPQIGLPVPDGVAWNYIKAEAPGEPDLLKNGTLSTKKNMNTTWAIYRATIEKYGLKVKDYIQMREQLEGKEDNFFKRKYLPTNKHITGNIIKDVITTASEMQRKLGKVTTRTIGKHCDWCDFYDVCQAELRGLDSTFIRKANYEEVQEEDRKKRT